MHRSQLHLLSTLLVLIVSVISGYAQSWQAEVMTGWTSRTDRNNIFIDDNIHLETAFSRSLSPHWRAQVMYLLQGQPTRDIAGIPFLTTHNLSAGMIYEEPDPNTPICLFFGWLAGSVLYDPAGVSASPESQLVINTVMGVRGHFRDRVGYKVQGLLLMPIVFGPDRFSETDFWLGVGPQLTQIALNAGVTYDF